MTNASSPSHDSITRRAQQIWHERGHPEGHDTAIWLEAERQLSTPTSADHNPSSSEGRGNGKSQSGGTLGDPKVAPPAHQGPSDLPAASPIPNEAAALSEQQKKAARAPQQLPKPAPRAKTPETGKPVWPKPHSS